MTGTPLPCTFNYQPRCGLKSAVFLLLACWGLVAPAQAQQAQQTHQDQLASALPTDSANSLQNSSPGNRAFELQGHRGCRGLMPENSIPGFLHALELGVRVLELDVCISADGQVVVSHEPWISDEICTAGIPGTRPQSPAAAAGSTQNDDPQQGKARHFGLLDYAAISRYDCGSLPHPRFPEQQQHAAAKPLLREVLQHTETWARERGQTIAYNIELKSRPQWDGVEQPGPDQALPLLLALMEESDANARWHLQSFDYRVLRLARKLAPSLPLVQLVEENPSMALEIKRLGFEPAVYSPWYKLVTPELVKKAHKRGIRVIPWTVNEPEDMQRLIEMGVDGLITDYPNRALALPNMH